MCKIVHDKSAIFNSTSLSSCMYQGPHSAIIAHADFCIRYYAEFSITLNEYLFDIFRPSNHHIVLNC